MRTVVDMRTFEDRGVYQDFGIVAMDWDEDLHRESVREFYWRRGFDPRKTLMLYYDEQENIFYEADMCGGLEAVPNIYEVIEPWKVILFKKNGECVFTDRTNSFLVEFEWLPF